jgi:RNA recognition motif-containing protein
LVDTLVYVKPVKPDFTWRDVNSPIKTESGNLTRFFYQSLEKGTQVTTALKPLFENRRCMLQVQTPGWSNKNNANREAINKHLGSFGIECISKTSSFYGDKKPEPRLLCFIDFATEEGAQAAIKAIHDTEIEGVRVSLRQSHLAPWRADQIGRFDMNALQELQKAGRASKETHPDKFAKKRDGATKPSFVRRVQTGAA